MRTSADEVQCSTRVVIFGPKVGQIGPKWDKCVTFSDQISVHFGPKLDMAEVNECKIS